MRTDMFSSVTSQKSQFVNVDFASLFLEIPIKCLIVSKIEMDSLHLVTSTILQKATLLQLDKKKTINLMQLFWILCLEITKKVKLETYSKTLD